MAGIGFCFFHWQWYLSHFQRLHKCLRSVPCSKHTMWHMQCSCWLSQLQWSVWHIIKIVMVFLKLQCHNYIIIIRPSFCSLKIKRQSGNVQLGLLRGGLNMVVRVYMISIHVMCNFCTESGNVFTVLFHLLMCRQNILLWCSSTRELHVFCSLSTHLWHKMNG